MDRSVRQVVTCVAALLSALATGSTGLAQSPRDPSAFDNGVAYTFERAEAKRVVNDAYDKGTIRIASYIWRPVQATPNRVAIFSHGSLGGMALDPHEPFEYMPPELLEFLVRKGYTVVLPLRRGIGASTGTFVEECAYVAGLCTLEDYRRLAASGLEEAVLDTNAVIDQLIEGRIVPKGSPILFTGVSRGGLLSLRMAAERPRLTAGVVNFVGGWLSMTDAWPPAENEARSRLQRDWLRLIGKRESAPTLWIYAAKDSFYSAEKTRAFFDAFEEGGGRGTYFFVASHGLRNGHAIAADPVSWSDAVSGFLESLPGAAGK